MSLCLFLPQPSGAPVENDPLGPLPPGWGKFASHVSHCAKILLLRGAEPVGCSRGLASVRFLTSVPVTDRSGLEESPLFRPNLKPLRSLGRTMWVFLGTLASSPRYINNGFLTELGEVIQNVLSTSASHCGTVRFWWNVAKRWQHGRAFSSRRAHF